MELVEEFKLGKSQEQELCEDGYILTEDYLVVVDGATAKTGKKYAGVSSGKYLMELVIRLVKEFPSGLGKEVFFRKLEEGIQEDYKKQGWYEGVKGMRQDRPTVAVGVYTRESREIWLCGDVQVMLVGEGREEVYTNEKKVDKVTSEVRRMVNEIELALGNVTKEGLQERDVGRDYIRYLLENQTIFQNNTEFESELNYTALDGFNCDYESIKELKVADWVEGLVMATDGYPILRRTLRGTEKELRGLLEEDPLCIGKLLSTKGLEKGNNSYDDRLYVRLRLQG